jgi:hypothetical protein
MNKAEQELREYYTNRLNAGLPLTLLEWDILSDLNRAIWVQTLADFKLKELAITARFIADSIQGGTLAIEAVWDTLPETVQDKYLKQWSQENAKRGS